MKLNKAMAEALNEMFGPNPSRHVRVSTNTLRFKAFQELERVGLVRIERAASTAYESLRDVTRRMDENGKPLVQLAKEGKL